MRAVRIDRTGGPEVLMVEEAPEPRPGSGEVLIRHAAIGLNFIDTYQRTGLYPVPMPATLGLEAAGVVEAVGEGVTRFAAGDRVGYNGTLGAYAEAAVVKADRAVLLPDEISFEVAAACLLKGMTADVVLVHAAAGGVGGLLVQWLKALEVTVIAAVGSSQKAEVTRAHGADHVLLYRDEDVAARVREITGGLGVQVVYDSVGRATFDASLASLARRGLLVSFGNASGPPPAVEPLRLSRGGSLYLTRPTLSDYIASTEQLDATAAALFHVIETGQVKIEIGRRFPLAEARAAHEALEGRETTGATVLTP